MARTQVGIEERQDGRIGRIARGESGTRLGLGSRGNAGILVLVAAAVALACSCQRCSGSAIQEPLEPPGAGLDATKEAAPAVDPVAANEAAARGQVRAFLHNVRIEDYRKAYDGCSPILKDSYTYDQFLMVAGKLQMEELPCILEDDIDAMIPTKGPVGLGPEDVEVPGFRILYACEGDGQDRALVVYLDWDLLHLEPSRGVASFFFP